jgi:hypothetical protein
LFVAVVLAASTLAGATNFAPSVNPLANVPANGAFNAIACTSTTSCVSVGSDLQPYVDQFGNPQPIVEDGNPAAWTGTRARAILLGASFGEGGSLDAVTCPSPTVCVAVGGDENGQPLALFGNPSSWHAAQASELTLGAAFGNGGQLSAVTCTTTSDCVAVGSDGNGYPLVIAGNPATWSAADAKELTLSFTTSGALSAIACPSPTSCSAVGSIRDGAEPLLVHGNPSTWGPAQANELDLGSAFSGGGQLASIVCTSTTSCVAAGNDGVASRNSGELEPLMLEGNPATWGLAQARQVNLQHWAGLDGNVLTSIQCTTRTSCVAAGSDGDQQPLVLRGNPASWGAAQVNVLGLNSNFGSTGDLTGIACANATTCDSVGYDGRDEPIVLHGHPASWHSAQVSAVALTGVPFGVESQVAALDCTASTACVAVDNVPSMNGASTATIDAGVGTWRTATARWISYGKAESGDGTYSAIACTASRRCVAVGSDGNNEPLVLQGDPHLWAPAQARELTLKPALESGQLNGIDCRSATFCVGVGMDGNRQPLVLVGNPSTWRAASATEVTLGSKFGGGGALSAVTCTSETSCIAVGVDTGNEPLVLRGDPAVWNAARASVISLGAGLGNMGSLPSVACTSASSCAAVGSDGNGVPLALVGNPANWKAANAFALSIGAPTGNSVGGYAAGDVTGGALSNIECISASNCVAVGADGTGAPIYETGSPASWATTPALRPTATPTVSAAINGFTGLSCTGGTCYVTGDTDTGPFLSPL